MATSPKDPPHDGPTLPGKPKAAATPPAPPESARDVETIPPGAGGARQELYLRLMTEQLTGWDNPRAMLERALRENQFLLLAQKIIPLKKGTPEPVCYEVLLRLKQEEDSMLPPGGFLDLAESLGMMPKIDRWVLRYVLNWCAAKLKSRPADPLPMMCVNLSGRALMSTSFLAAAREEFAAAGVPPRTICFEISERDAIEHRDRAQAFMEALKPLGCRFTVDAFGSVRVSFSYLEGLPFDFLKIDGVIIDGIHGRLGPATVKAINIVCQEVGMRTIAEFVESKETLGKLREIGVDYVQGFGVSRPVPITKVQ